MLTRGTFVQIIFPKSDYQIFSYPNPLLKGFSGWDSVAMVAPFWDDVDFSSSQGTMFYQVGLSKLSTQGSPAASKERQRPVWRALQVFLLSEPSCQWVGIEAFMRVGRNLIRTQPCSEDCRWCMWVDHPLFDFRMRLQGVHSIKAESSRAPASAPGLG